MGVVYLEASVGDLIACCRTCRAFIANMDDVQATTFRGATGAAKLFNKVYNVVQGRVEKRRLLSGEHFVREVSCKRCSSRLGWFYEFARDACNVDKEGRTCLEDALLRVTRGWPRRQRQDEQHDERMEQEGRGPGDRQPPDGQGDDEAGQGQPGQVRALRIPRLLRDDVRDDGHFLQAAQHLRAIRGNARVVMVRQVPGGPPVDENAQRQQLRAQLDAQLSREIRANRHRVQRLRAEYHMLQDEARELDRIRRMRGAPPVEEEHGEDGGAARAGGGGDGHR